MNIQWFPGHMAKARRHVEERLHQVDVVMELLDARLPLSSRNPMMHEILSGKPRLVLLNKSDLADEKGNQKWMNYFSSRGTQAALIDARSGKGVRPLSRLAADLMQQKWQALKDKGIQRPRVRCMIVGIPNVGKSSLINRLAGRAATRTGDRPGMTKAEQWIRVGKEMQLLDTPGILWPKFDDPEVGLRLAASGAIKEDLLPIEEVAIYVVRYLRSRYTKGLKARYRMDELPEDEVHLLEVIGQKRGCMRSGGIIDLEKASEVLLHDLRSGRLGKITLEFPADWADEPQ